MGLIRLRWSQRLALFDQHKGDADMTQELCSKVKQSAGKPGSEALFRMEDISFSYQKNVPVLEHLTFVTGSENHSYYRTKRCGKNDIGPFIKRLTEAGFRNRVFWAERIFRKRQ